MCQPLCYVVTQHFAKTISNTSVWQQWLYSIVQKKDIPSDYDIHSQLLNCMAGKLTTLEYILCYVLL